MHYYDMSEVNMSKADRLSKKADDVNRRKLYTIEVENKYQDILKILEEHANEGEYSFDFAYGVILPEVQARLEEDGFKVN